MMKRIFCALIAMLLLLSCAASAVADAPADEAVEGVEASDETVEAAEDADEAAEAADEAAESSDEAVEAVEAADEAVEAAPADESGAAAVIEAGNLRLSIPGTWTSQPEHDRENAFSFRREADGSVLVIMTYQTQAVRDSFHLPGGEEDIIDMDALISMWAASANMASGHLAEPVGERDFEAARWDVDVMGHAVSIQLVRRGEDFLYIFTAAGAEITPDELTGEALDMIEVVEAGED